MSIIIKNLKKYYPTKKNLVKAVDDISFDVKPGDFLAIHGASGCGKSTLLLMLGGLLHPTGGTVDIKDVNPYKLSNKACAAFRTENIGFVFQQFHLIPYLDIRDNIMVPALASYIEDLNMKVDESLEKFNLLERAHHKPSTLSIGEQQRVAMARALINSPKIILADEPTGNLDPDNSEIVLNTFKEFANQGGIVIMVTHEKSAINAAFSNIALDKGKLK